MRTAEDGRLDRGLDKLRKKIWGSDKPPGLENPYGDGSILEQNERRRQRQKKDNEVKDSEVKQRPQQKAKAYKPVSSYEPAETWDGLQRVGGYGNWWAQNWDPLHPFKSFVPADREANEEVITACLHRAMVEVFTVREVGETLSIVSQTVPGEDITADIQLVQSATGVRLQFPESVPLEQIIQSLSPPIDETEEKFAPTEFEEDVAADRSSTDPLHPESTPELVDETATKEAPTESEEDVAADRSTVDPLKEDVAPRYYTDVIASWDPSWLQISLENPEVKFAVSLRQQLREAILI
jgi:hypothetical protein